MRAVILEQFGGAEHLADATLPVPAVGTQDVLIRVKAVGFNPTDYQLRQSGHPTLTPPVILGRDVAGIVEACGGGGDRAEARRRGLFQHRAALARRLCGVCRRAALVRGGEARLALLPRGGVGAGRQQHGPASVAARAAGCGQVAAGGGRRGRGRVVGDRLRQGVRHHAPGHHGGQRGQPRLHQGRARHRRCAHRGLSRPCARRIGRGGDRRE